MKDVVEPLSTILGPFIHRLATMRSEQTAATVVFIQNRKFRQAGRSPNSCVGVRAQVRAQNVRTPFPDVAASEIRRNQGQRPKGELVGADLVLAATRLAFGQTHWLGLDLPGAAFALVGGDLAGGAAGICRTRLGGVLC